MLTATATKTRNQWSNQLNELGDFTLPKLSKLRIAARLYEQQYDIEANHGFVTPAEQMTARLTAKLVRIALDRPGSVQPHIHAELRANGLGDWAEALESGQYHRLAL